MNNTHTQDHSGAHLDLKDLTGKYLTFTLAEEDFGLEIMRVREIIGLQDITPVPRTPEFVQGVINLRGKVIPVIDLRGKFGMPFKEPDERTCIIVTEVAASQGALLMGVIVDRVNEVSEVKGEEVEPTPDFGMQLDTDFILGMAKNGESVKTLLDIDQVLNQSQVAALAAT